MDEEELMQEAPETEEDRKMKDEDLILDWHNPTHRFLITTIGTFYAVMIGWSIGRTLKALWLGV